VPEIRLEHDDQGEAAGDDGDGQQRVRDLVDPVHPPLEHRGGEDDGDDLREFGWLPAEAANRDPAVRPVPGGEQKHGEQRNDRHPEQRPDDLGPPKHVIVDAHHDEQRHQSHQRPRQLAQKDFVGASVFVLGDDRGGAEDHHEARADEHDRLPEQHLCRL
jgi:hypothetical protein